MKIETKCVWAGVSKNEKTGSISMPIYQTATFKHPGLTESTGYDYSRTGNPTREAVEKSIAELESGTRGLAFSSGMAAISAFIHLFKSGDHIIVSNDLYGGTYRLLEQIYASLGLKVTYVNTSDLAQMEKAVKGITKGILIESPSNPMMKIADISLIADFARRHGLLLAVDNTFMTPYWQQPLSLGADIVIHSASKYLGGHNDLVAGLIAVKDPGLGEKLGFIQNSIGSILGPQDSWLLLRGLKTLAVRLEQSQKNAFELVHWLKKHPQVKSVYYPGLKEHPGYQIMTKNCTGFGAMISFEVAQPALIGTVLNRLKLISFAESLGGVESLITFPCQQTHADIPKEIRDELGITDCLLRLSVGIEHVGDLINDLDQALTIEEDN
ncbi:PLP-dependent aspartate aminotransferase family protein [Metallumcola ferriviriculae]|uniref:PLP-dependent aspartate aminotransferase family protein n=1 Tax=Metallumcola ferriviriculae TaxID=3039180 RepID=A0AAU0UPH8_9FIRM|nr:PLP-dependent aspartate aminotransferase family protein [Desulfitibacteraceae bacterium MK1]